MRGLAGKDKGLFTGMPQISRLLKLTCAGFGTMSCNVTRLRYRSITAEPISNVILCSHRPVIAITGSGQSYCLRLSHHYVNNNE
ncbi:hypothetical protein TIFTF001_012192 [Ficus carica]|uniref:Uncharacterized protein n=1 Tax=Ficus carica TaxID=3494 RepID=A0AA87ZZM2_FICCA|nr:hypothetical protein TIFTF001_012192 [Ficus carica]